MTGLTNRANAPIPTDPTQLRSHVDLAVLLFSQVSTDHDAVVSGDAATLALQAQALAQAMDTIASLKDDISHAETEAATDRAMIRNLGMRVPTHWGDTSRPIPISDHAMFDGNKDDLEAFLDGLTNKLWGDVAQFTNEVHQIPYAISRLTGDTFEQIRGSYATYTTVFKLTTSLKAASGTWTPRGPPNASYRPSAKATRTSPDTRPTSPPSPTA